MIPILGDVLVFTGGFYTMDWVSVIVWAEKLGFRVSGVVNANTAFLLIGSNPYLPKILQAKKLNRFLEKPIVFIGELEFSEMIDEYRELREPGEN